MIFFLVNNKAFVKLVECGLDLECTFSLFKIEEQEEIKENNNLLKNILSIN